MHDVNASSALLRGVARRLLRQHASAARTHPSPLNSLLCRVAGPELIERGPLRPWLDLLAGAFLACGGRPREPQARCQLEITMAGFAAAMAALEVLDDLADDDPPEGGCQAPNLALALLGESVQLLCHLPAGSGSPLLALWGDLWVRCAAAQALDVALAGRPDLTVEQSLAVASGSGLVTRWAVEAGAIVADAPPALLTPLRAFGGHLGAAEKLLHDLHDLWPGPHPSRDLARPTCNLALIVAREMGIDCPRSCAEATSEDARRRRLLACGALHYAWACADERRLQAASGLEAFAAAGGDAAPLRPALALPADLQILELQDTQL